MFGFNLRYVITLLCLSGLVACAPKNTALNPSGTIQSSAGKSGMPLYQTSSLLPDTSTVSAIPQATISDLPAFDKTVTGSIKPVATMSTYSNPMGSTKSAYTPMNPVASPVAVMSPTSLTPVMSAVRNYQNSSTSAATTSYNVQNGDTIYSIGRKLNVNPHMIMSTNSMNSQSVLSVGQMIKIPSTGGTSYSAMQSSSYASPAQASPNTGSSQYSVQPGDTIYAISRKFNVKPSDLIVKNPHINPNQLGVGQVLTISGIDASKASLEPTKTVFSDKKTLEQKIATAPKVVSPVSEPQKQASFSNPTVKPFGQTVVSQEKILAMPVQGAVKKDDTLRGILISAKDGDNVKASADGEVIYVGNLSNYGNMILVRHSNGLITNYARLKKTFVQKGQRVGRGDLIASAGVSNDFKTSEVLFEVRKGAKPVNPLDYVG